MKLKILFFGFFLLCSIYACTVSTLPDKNKTQQNSDTIRLAKLNGSFIIDTFSVLTHKNLEPLLLEIEKSNLKSINKVKEIPFFIIYFMKGLTKDGFTMADPNENWQSGCGVEEGLAARQLIYFGFADNIALMGYYTGGVGVSEHILIIKFSGQKIQDFWCGNVLKDLKNKEQILNYIKENKSVKWGLGTNYIYL